MEKNEEIKTILGIALLYSTITGILSLLNRLAIFILQGSYGDTIKFFIQKNALWFIVVIGTIFILSLYIRKLTPKFLPYIIQDKVICLVTGILVIIEGLINFSIILPIFIISMQTSIQTLNIMGESINGLISKTIISNGIPLFFYILQMVLGIYIIKFYKGKTRNAIRESEDR